MLPCKVCDSREVAEWRHLAGYWGAYTLLQCGGCGFRFCPYLDPDAPAGLEITQYDIEKHKAFAATLRIFGKVGRSKLFAGALNLAMKASRLRNKMVVVATK